MAESKKVANPMPDLRILSVRRDGNTLSISLRTDLNGSKQAFDELEEGLCNYCNSLSDLAERFVVNALAAKKNSPIRLEKLKAAETLYACALELNEGFRTAEYGGKWMTWLYLDAAAVAYRLGDIPKGNLRVSKAKEWFAKLQAQDEKERNPNITKWLAEKKAEKEKAGGVWKVWWDSVRSGLDRAQETIKRGEITEGLKILQKAHREVKEYNS